MRRAFLLLFSALILVLLPACTSSGGTGTGGTTTTTSGTGTGGDPAHLDPPPSGQGFQFGTPEFAVPSGDEEQDCYFFLVSDLAKLGGLDPTKPVNLHHIQVAQRVGSHHMNIFQVKTIVNLGPAGGAVQKGTNGMGQCFVSSNWADWPLVANSQQEGDVDWTYPDGVANVLQPDQWLMLQTHFVNASTQQTPADGQVNVNFWSIPDSAVTAEMGTIFATKQSIRICQSNPTPTFSGSCQINSPSPVNIIGANGHFHSRGKTFDMFTWDGMSTTTPPAAQQFYTSTMWDEPPMMHSPQLEVAVPANGGVFYTCSYEWVEPPPAIGCTGLNAFDEMKYMTPADKVDCCYTFGPIVDKNEHCNAFVYYYPKQDNVNCF
jgi:hypothetical protein